MKTDQSLSRRPLAQKRIRDFIEPGVHERELTKHFGADKMGCTASSGPGRVVFMMFINRSGSNYLSELLHSTGQLGQFGEHFNHTHVIPHSRTNGVGSLQAYMEETLVRTDKPSCSKLSVDQAVMLMRHGYLDRFADRIDWLYIRRRDILEQAVSYHIAAQTNRWKSSHPASDREPSYDFASIAAFLASIAEISGRINLFFGGLGIRPVEVIYEDLVEQPGAETARVLGALGLESREIDPARLTLVKQATDANQAYKQRYRADMLELVRASGIGADGVASA